jgi:hypothetical protein
MAFAHQNWIPCEYNNKNKVKTSDSMDLLIDRFYFPRSVGVYVEKRSISKESFTLTLLLLPKNCANEIAHELERTRNDGGSGYLFNLYLPIDFIILPYQTLRKRNIWLNRGSFYCLSFFEKDDKSNRVLGVFDQNSPGNNTHSFQGYFSINTEGGEKEIQIAREQFMKLEDLLEQ